MDSKGKYDKRNKLNDLTGKEWLKLTGSFWTSEKCANDKIAMQHPAPFLIKDTQKLISMFTKKGMRVLDPFCGSGTALIASCNIDRIGIGIDLNAKYKELALGRLKQCKNFEYIIGNALNELDSIEKVDYIITSPPYHNILKNKGKGLREDKESKGFRHGGRLGVEYYSDNHDDLGNKETYQDFLQSLSLIMKKCYKTLNNKKYCSIIISDFTVNKKEVNVQGDIVNMMCNIGFEFSGTTVLLQPNKPLYPFGYPYAYKINHHHQNIITFRKDMNT